MTNAGDRPLGPRGSGRVAAHALVGLVAAVLGSVGCLTHVGSNQTMRPDPKTLPATSRAAADPTRAAPAGRSGLVEKVLPSGLQILLLEDSFARTAGVVSLVTGGSGLDPSGAEGLAHLVEHLSYRAVDGGGSGLPRWDRLTRSGAVESNGYTTKDALLFYEFAAPSQLNALLDLEVARLTNPLVGVDENALAIERHVIGTEVLMREDPRAGGWAANALYPLLFPAPHPYARSPGGTEDSRRRLTLDQARAFAAAAFRPERMTLLVAAPPGTTSLEAIVARLPPSLSGDPARRVAHAVPVATPAPTATTAGSPPAAAMAAFRVERRDSPLAVPELWIGWTLPGSFGGLGPMQDFLERWVEVDLRADRVFEEAPQIRHVQVSVQPGVHASTLLLRVLMAEGADPDRIAQVVTSRATSVWSREPTAQPTFTELKALFETQYVLGQPSGVTRAVTLASLAALGGRTASVRELWSALQAVSSTSVAELAYKYITRERARSIFFAPKPVAAEVARRAAPAHGRSSSTGAGGELVPGAAAWDPQELRAILPKSLPVTRSKLANGLTVITVPRPGTAATAWLAFRGGWADADPPLLAELSVRVRPDAQQATRLHMLPGRSETRDMSFETVEFLPGQLAEALTLLFAKATIPVKAWPSKEEMARILAPLVSMEDAVATKSAQAFWRKLIGDHPYARVVSSRDLERFTQSDVDAWLGRVRSVRNAALIVVGNVRPAEVERAAGILARQMKTPEWVPDLPAPPKPALRSAGAEHLAPVVVGRPGALTDIRLGCLLPSMAAADRGHYELLGHAIDVRLTGALRVDSGDSYVVSVDVDRLRGGMTYLVASTSVSDQNLVGALGAMRGHWQRWVRDGFDAGELNVARWRYAGLLTPVFASDNALAYQLLGEWNADPTARIELLQMDVAALRAARVNELFAACKANAVLGLTGNEALIQRALEQAWPSVARQAAAGKPDASR